MEYCNCDPQKEKGPSSKCSYRTLINYKKELEAGNYLKKKIDPESGRPVYYVSKEKLGEVRSRWLRRKFAKNSWEQLLAEHPEWFRENLEQTQKLYMQAIALKPREIRWLQYLLGKTLELHDMEQKERRGEYVVIEGDGGKFTLSNRKTGKIVAVVNPRFPEDEEAHAKVAGEATPQPAVEQKLPEKEKSERKQKKEPTWHELFYGTKDRKP